MMPFSDDDDGDFWIDVEFNARFCKRKKRAGIKSTFESEGTYFSEEATLEKSISL
jgi:hypothetical protein